VNVAATKMSEELLMQARPAPPVFAAPWRCRPWHPLHIGRLKLSMTLKWVVIGGQGVQQRRRQCWCACFRTC